MSETERVKRIKRITYAHGGRGSIFEYGRDGRFKYHASIITDGDESVSKTEYYD